WARVCLIAPQNGPTTKTIEEHRTNNTGLVSFKTRAAQCCADTFPTEAGQIAIDQSLVLRINPDNYREGEIATYVKPRTSCVLQSNTQIP
ncbi:MAG: hypothetical protein ABI002_02845, partial [Saprospiraceae bacterium]